VTIPEVTHAVYLQNTTNCTADMAAVIAAAKARLAGTQDTLILQFPAGTYNFNDDATGVYISAVTNGSLIVRGAGTNSTVLCFNAISRVGFWVNTSDRVTVENLHLTRPGYYASQFDVVSVDANGAYLQIHAGFPAPEELKYNGEWNGQEVTLLPFRYVDGDPQQDPCDNKTLLYQIDGDPSVFPFTDMGNGLWYAKFKLIGLPGWGAGDMVALKMRTGQNTLRFADSDDCIARDLLITRSCGNPIRTFRETNRLLVERVHVARPIGGVGGRTPFFAGSDGGIQLVSGPEGPTVRNCRVDSTADDAIAVFSNTTNLTKNVVLEGNTIYDGQARGINICPSRNVTIRSNTFYRGDWYSIAICQENAATNMLGGVTDCDIYGNIFVDCLVDPVIGLDAVQNTPIVPHNNINIHHNTFIGATKNNNLVYVNAADTVDISSNTVVSFNPEDDMNSAQTGDALVFVKDGLNVTGTGNVSQQSAYRAPWEKARTYDNVNVEWSGLLPPPSLATLIYSNNFSGAEFKAAGIPAGYYNLSTNSASGVLEATNSGSVTPSFRVALTNLNLNTLTAIKVSADVKMPTTTNGTIYLGFGNESNDYNMASAGDGMIAFPAVNRKTLVYGGAGGSNLAATSANNVYPTNSTFKAAFTYYTNNTVDVAVNGINLYTNLAVTSTVGNNLDYVFLNLRQQNTEAAGGATFDNLVITTFPVSTGVYTLTVNSGSGSGSYTNGHVQAIVASNLFAKTFAAWTGDTQYLGSAASVATNTVIMSTNPVTLTATYVDTTYALTVINGSGTGPYTNGQVVGIGANAPAVGYAFDKWTGDTQYVASVSSSNTTVTMPAQAIAVTATYIATEQYTTNGTPYSWLDQYGLTNHVADDLLDQDLDGLKTWQEYIAGTVPTNAASCLKVAQSTRNVVTWSPVTGRVYSVCWSTNLVKGFTILPGASNIVHPQGSYTNTTPDAKVNHYQVKVQLP
jgi:parallel beta-helix repeat protein